MLYKCLPTSNVRRLDEASLTLINRPLGIPGMGLIEGHTGYGKTTAVQRFINQCNGVYIRVVSTVTIKGLLQQICDDLQIVRRGSNHDLLRRVVEALTIAERPLFFDEADYLVDSNNKKLIEALRDLHDMTEVPVILIGMKGIKNKISDYPQLTGRIEQHVEFKPNTFQDSRLIANELCEVKVGDELLQKLHKATRGSVRHLVKGLSRLERTARALKIDKIDIEDWKGGDEFFTGTPPAR